jgi:polysaccharide biosynthesis transport protein
MANLDHKRTDALGEHMARPEADLFRERDEINISDYLRIFSRRRWSILAIWLSVVAIAFIYNFVATKLYASRAAIIIRVGTGPTVFRTKETYFPNNMLLRTEFETKVKMINSRPVLAKAGEKLVGAGYFRPENFEKLSEEEKQKLYKAVGSGLGGRVSTLSVENTNLVYITATDTEPKRAAAIANAVAEAMVNYNAMEQEMWALNSLKFLNQQMEEAGDRLNQAESKLSEYKQKNKIFETTLDKNALTAQRATLIGALTQIDSEAKMYDARIQAFHTLLARKDYGKYASPTFQDPGAQSTFNSMGQTGLDSNRFVTGVGQDPVLLELSSKLVTAEIDYNLLTQKYKEEHPQVVEAKNKIDVLRSKFEEQLNRKIVSLELERGVLMAKREQVAHDLDAMSTQASDITSKDAEYTVLEREANSAKDLFTSLLGAVKEASIQANGQYKDLIYIHEYAVPVNNPIRPNRMLNLLIAALMGMILGLGWAVVVEMMDRSIRTPEDVEFHAHIPILSLLPHLEQEMSKEHAVVTERPRSLYSEGILHLRANLRLTLSHYNIKSFIITSCSPKEGKSMVAANLALSMAQEGIRTLLIDADLRRPVQHKFFGLNREMGVTRAIIDMFQNPEWKSNLSQYTFGDLNLLLKLQKLSGMVTLNLNSGHPLKLLYQNGQIIAGNLKDWKVAEKAKLEDVSPEEIKLDFSESSGQHHILPALTPGDVDEFFNEFPSLVSPAYFSYNLFEKYTYPAPVEGLRVMPSGPIPSNPGEILGSGHFRELINMLRPKFDLIIYDAAPCWPLSDVSMLSPVAEGIVFLVRAKRINRDILNRNLQMLKMLDFRIMGAVFNDFDIKKERYYYGSYYHYHYYYYYYYYYSYGYGSEEDKS